MPHPYEKCHEVLSCTECELIFMMKLKKISSVWNSLFKKMTNAGGIANRSVQLKIFNKFFNLIKSYFYLIFIIKLKNFF